MDKKKQIQENIPCYTVFCSCPEKFVGDQGNDALDYAKGSLLVELENDFFQCQKQGP